MRKIVLLALLIFNIIETKAQVGTLDPSFGTNGYVTLGVTFVSTAFQPDGKLVGVQNVGPPLIIYQI